MNLPQQLRWRHGAAFFALSLAAVLLVVPACAGGSSQKTVPSSPIAASAVAQLSAAQTAPAATDTPVYSTAPALMATPTSTAHKGAGKGKADVMLTADDVLGAFKKRGLPLGQTADLTAATDPDTLLGKAGAYTSKAQFTDTRLSDPAATPGYIEAFATAADAHKRVKALGGTKDSLTVYERGNVVLRLPAGLQADQVSEYELALRDAIKIKSRQAQRSARPTPAANSSGAAAPAAQQRAKR